MKNFPFHLKTKIFWQQVPQTQDVTVDLTQFRG